MSIPISNLVRTMPAASIAVGGMVLSIRAVSAAETDAVKRAILRPAPEMKPSEFVRNGKPVMVADENDPEHQAKIDLWMGLVHAAVVAIAAEIELGGLGRPAWREDGFPAYIRAASAQLREVYTDIEIEHIYAAVSNLSDPFVNASGESRIDAAKKNWSDLLLRFPIPATEALKSLLDGSSPAPTASPSTTAGSASANG